eukprot:CAMPEP_0177713272 /NCGR_PEP_ID=MMETSP0484_2-20121128/12850_1 /TAXON_ID=354590 /ORGANISM="Rhodomonas lens, Strain RHODO" /LENGTH=350 /DNA_ID=CAMNT_0019225149 /DNA_START=248 /DNA_END=1297 /DNA_ORIENTATION=+
MYPFMPQTPPRSPAILRHPPHVSNWPGFDDADEISTRVPLNNEDAKQARAIPFVTYSQHSGFTMNPEASAILSNQPAPLRLLTVFGPPRTGKTTFIRKAFFGQDVDASSSEDNDGAGEEAATTDAVILWLWNVPAKYSRGDAGGNKVTEVMVCESGRCEEVEESVVFALCVLLSSLLVYNGVRLLDSLHIDKLMTVRSLTRTIRVKEGVGEEDGVCFKQHFPRLTWLLRDCDAEVLDERRHPLSSQAFLERALRVRGFSEEAEQKNMVRKMLLSFFPEQDCFILPSPSPPRFPPTPLSASSSLCGDHKEEREEQEEEGGEGGEGEGDEPSVPHAHGLLSPHTGGGGGGRG